MINLKRFCKFGFLYFLFILQVLSLSAQQIDKQHLGKGVVYYEIHNTEVPQVIQVLEIDRNTNVELRTVLGGAHVLGIEPLDKLINRISKSHNNILAAVNGDFYLLRKSLFQGDLTGLCIINGELISSPVNRSALLILDDGDLVIDRYKMNAFLIGGNGEKISINGVNQRCPKNGIVINTPHFYTETRAQKGSVQFIAGKLSEPLMLNKTYRFTVSNILKNDSVLVIPEDKVAFIGCGSGARFLGNIKTGEKLQCSFGLVSTPGKIKNAVGGTPRLLRNSEISIEAEEEKISESFVTTRHPRTAVGFNKEKIFLVTVDGRQLGYSVGMNLHELANLLKELGADEALNLDGGGSTTMWVNGEIKNRPSDGHVRSIANALILVRKKE